jgi:predicted DNA-binding transcriptional regulator AlpA
MRILTVKQTCDKLGKGRTKLWELTKDGRFPKPIRIDGGIGYLEHEVDQWIANLVAARDREA